MKTCAWCGISKDESEFYAHEGTKDRLYGHCKDCHRRHGAQRKAERRQDPAFREYERRVRIQHNRLNPSKRTRKALGITLDQYRQMYETQGAKCGICKVLFDATNKDTTACLDHDHMTGKPRGLLCHKCNRALGFLGEKNLLAAAKWCGWGVVEWLPL